MERKLLSEQAYEEIREAIVVGDLPPGSRVRDQEIAEQVGLSRTPVREALNRLTDDGLIIAKPHAYTVVAPLNARDCMDALVVIGALNEAAMRLAVPRMTAADIADLKAANTRFQEATSVDEALAADDEFHAIPVRIAENRLIEKAIDRYLPLVRRAERLWFHPVPAQSIDHHLGIIDACANGEVDRAVEHIRANWQSPAQLFEGATHDEH